MSESSAGIDCCVGASCESVVSVFSRCLRLARSGEEARAARGLEARDLAPLFPPKRGGRLASDFRGAGMGGGGGIRIEEAKGSTSMAGFHPSRARHQTWQFSQISPKVFMGPGVMGEY